MFSTKSLHFPGGVPKKPEKPKILDSSGLAFAKTLKSGFLVLFGTSSGNGNVFHQKLAFSWRGTKKTKKNKDFGLFNPRLRQDSKIVFFLFFWYLLRKWQRFPPKACIFLEGYQQKTKKTKDFGLFRPRLRQKKSKILDSSGLAFAKTLKSGFFVLFGTSSGNGNVFHQKLAFSRGVPKKPKKPKILHPSGLAFAKTLKSLVFLIFWYLLRKWQHFLSWLFCLLTAVSYSCISNR